MGRTTRLSAAIVVSLACTLCGPALAQNVPPPPSVVPEAESHEPAPDVARLSLTEGEVSVTDGGSGEWGAGQVNAPLVGGDEVVTGDKARAEITLDTQNVVRLDGDTQLRLAQFTREHVAIELPRGRLAYALGTAPVIPVTIAGPGATFQPREAGFYVVQAAGDGALRVTVRRGQGTVARGDEQRAVMRGQTAIVGPTGDIHIQPAALPDAWESWTIRREDEMRGAQSWAKLNPNYVGAQDLDQHGDWRETPEYGRVWVPRATTPDWAPYREGYWTWKPYWGWVWVSHEPWGWTPYHYGRWVMVDGGWAWWPGPVSVTYVPVWAPAYVAFFDFHHHHRPGHVAWLPLGPADWCHPWWSRRNGPRPGGRGPDHVRAQAGQRLHAQAIRPLVPPDPQRFSVIRRAQEDARVRGAASELAVQKFGQRQRGSGAARVDDATYRNANMVVGAAPAMPTRAAPPRDLNPRPASVGSGRPAQVDKPMTRPALPSSAIQPQKIPGGHERSLGAPYDAPRAVPARPFPAPAGPAQGAGAPNSASPAAAPSPDADRVRERANRREPQNAVPVMTPRPQMTRPVDPPRQLHDDPVRPSTPPPAARPAPPMPVEPVKPSLSRPPAPQDDPVRPSFPPRVDRKFEPPRPSHADPIRPSAPPPQIQRPAQVEPMRPASPPPHMQRPAQVEPVRPAAPVRIERPSPPPQAAPPSRPSPPPQTAPRPEPPRPAVRQDAPRPSPQKNCGPKPCG